ncbi:MAG: hypothetical protein ACREL5_05805 [Gemmatimonadales bacterium]
MTKPSVAGFGIVRNATLLDFPFEASIASVLPGVDRFVLVVGVSEDDTLARARAIADRRIEIVESVWDLSAGGQVLSIETNRAMSRCGTDWGICIQADEVVADGGAAAMRRQIESVHSNRSVEGLVVDYLHFYGSVDRIATARSWYRREIRCVRLTGEIRCDGHAQGFRVGSERLRVRCVASGVTVFHYGAARPRAALEAKRVHDRAIYTTERAKDPGRPLLPWSPGLRTYAGPHPTPVASWIASRRGDAASIAPARLRWTHIKSALTLGIERLTGWRPFEFRNYTLR